MCDAPSHSVAANTAPLLLHLTSRFSSCATWRQDRKHGLYFLSFIFIIILQLYCVTECRGQVGTTTPLLILEVLGSSLGVETC